MQNFNIITISTNHPCYPESFAHIKPHISKFYAVGNVDLLVTGKRLAVVGSRKPSPYGADVTKSLVRSASKADICIVSGLALGIDSIAHQAALDAGARTIAVLPTSITNIYPVRHTNLAKQIIKNHGLIISEQPILSNPNKYHFVQRNRLIAALADLIVVPEAALGSGSRHTIEFGHQLGIPSAFVPGNITSSLSDYPNEEIKTGGTPINKATDIYHLLSVNEPVIGEGSRVIASNKHEQAIITALSAQNLSSDALMEAAGLPPAQFNVHLTMLEINGTIERSASNAWRLAK